MFKRNVLIRFDSVRVTLYGMKQSSEVFRKRLPAQCFEVEADALQNRSRI